MTDHPKPILGDTDAGPSENHGPSVQKIVAQLDEELRRRFKAAGVEARHAIVVMIPEEAAHFRCNTGVMELRTMAVMFQDIANRLENPTSPTVNQEPQLTAKTGGPHGK